MLKKKLLMESLKAKMNLINPQKPCERSNNNNPACPRHPKHIQSPGVCSLCLTEKLSQLPIYGAKLSKHHRWSSSSSHSFLSSQTSSCTSPRVHLQDKRKSGGMLKKSRSMAFFSRRKKDKDKDKDVTPQGQEKNVEAKRGIWSRLLRRKNNSSSDNRKGGLTHSRTTRERVVAAAIH